MGEMGTCQECLIESGGDESKVKTTPLLAKLCSKHWQRRNRKLKGLDDRKETKRVMQAQMSVASALIELSVQREDSDRIWAVLRPYLKVLHAVLPQMIGESVTSEATPDLGQTRKLEAYTPGLAPTPVHFATGTGDTLVPAPTGELAAGELPRPNSSNRKSTQQ